MRTRSVPGSSDTPDTIPGVTEEAAPSGVGASAFDSAGAAQAASDVETLFPGTSAALTTERAHPAAVPRPRTGTSLRDFFRNLSLDDRLGRIVLSMVLAVLLWFYVTSLENPARVTEFNDIAVEQRNAGQDLKIINTLPSIDVTLQAPQNLMSTLRPADVHPFIDLQGLDTGVHQVPVQLEVNGAAGRSLISSSVIPSEVQVQIEAQATRVFTLTARSVGTPAFGYGIEQPQVDPSEVRLTGPAEAISRVAQVVVEVSVDGEATTQQGLKSPMALDAEGQRVQGLTFEPESVQVVVPIKLLLSYKVVAVRANVTGNPAAGYSVVAIIPEPRSVTICCAPEEVIDPIQSLDTQPVGITNTTSTVITTTSLIIPDGVELYPGQSSEITVTIRLETFETNFTLAVVPTVEGLAAGAGAVVSPSSIDVRLTGTLAQFQLLRPEDVRAVLDLGGRGPGTYEIEPEITVPQGIKVEDVSPERMTVSVLAPTALPATPTPSPLPSPSPTATETAASGSAGSGTPSSAPTASSSPSAAPTAQPGGSGQPVTPAPTSAVTPGQSE